MMMSCPRSNLISAYHDGELPLAQTAELEAHLGDCADCRAELEQLRTLSLRIQAADLPEPSDEAVERWMSVFSDARDRSVRRLASWMTAAAALIMVGVGLVTLLDHRGAVTGPPILIGPADTVALVPEGAEAAPVSLVAAQWMAADLSGANVAMNDASRRRWP